MITCKACVHFKKCLSFNEVVVNVHGNDHVCEKFLPSIVCHRRKINKEELFVKAIAMDANESVIVHGCCEVTSYDDYVVRDEETRLCRIVNPITICKNSGVRDHNGKFVYEYDLLKLTKHDGSDSGYGFFMWNDFYGHWCIRRFATYSSCILLKDIRFVVCGNILLCSKDYNIILEQDTEEDKRNITIDNSYCPSRFKK